VVGCLLVSTLEELLNRQGYRYARLLLCERQQELHALDLKHRGMAPLPSDYLSSL